jgi:transcriptional regulator GlxA family with amidase domain
MGPKRTVGIVLFEGFELLDVFGPAEMFGVLPDHFAIEMLASESGLVASTQGPRVDIDRRLEDAAPDILLVPGGQGTRREVHEDAMLDHLRRLAGPAQWVTSVCTGAGLLAAAGLLDGRQATSNKLAFSWVESVGPDVSWQPKARWVEDGKFITSGGVAAGIDMSLALIAKLTSAETAEQVASGTEYDWHRQADWDPFGETLVASR